MRTWALVLVALAGCNADHGAALTDGSVGSDLSFAPAARLPFPQLTLHTTQVFSAPQLVTITYSDFAFRDQVEKLGDFIVTSQWLAAVGNEYGVGPGVHLKKAQLPDAGPPTITDAAIVTLLGQLAGAGTIPAPSAQNDQLVYLVYFPTATKIDDGTGTILCPDGYDGYHASSQLNGVTFAYAVLPDCSGVLDDLTSTVAHEVIESATDPDDAWYLDVAAGDLWSGLNLEEVGDLCQDEDNVTEAGWALQRSWSNASAMAGLPPCVPIPEGEVLLDVTPSPAMALKVKAGMSTTFTLTGWSTVPVPDWSLSSAVTDSADFDPMATISGDTINNGTTSTVTLSVPAGTARGKVGSAQIFSGPAGKFWPVTVIAN